MHTIEDVFMTVYWPHDRPVKDRAVGSRVRVDDFSAELNLFLGDSLLHVDLNQG